MIAALGPSPLDSSPASGKAWVSVPITHDERAFSSSSSDEVLAYRTAFKVNGAVIIRADSLRAAFANDVL